MDQRRFQWRSGRLASSPLIDGWALDLDSRDPSIPNLPLESVATIRIVASANIAAGGEATTARLTAPSGKTSGDFTTGRRWDNENGTDALTIAADQWTTIAWSIEANAAGVVDAEVYEFRVVADGGALDTYTVTPQWTIGTPPTPSMVPVQGTFARAPALRRF